MPTNYTFEDKKLFTGKYKYRLKQTDYNGNFMYYNLESDVIIGTPDNFDISQNYPNPFNPISKIDYSLPFDSKVMIIIYDILGREMMKLVNQYMHAGYYTATINGSDFASGVYFYRIVADKFVKVKKMVLIK